MLRPTLKQLQHAVKNDFKEWHCMGNLDGTPLVANICEELAPKHVFFDIKGYKTGVIIDFERLQNMKTQKEIENYVKAMLGFALSKGM